MPMREMTIAQRSAVVDESSAVGFSRGNPAHDWLCTGHGVARFPLPVWLGAFFLCMQGTAGTARAEVMKG
jgi:hypothetical protein